MYVMQQVLERQRIDGIGSVVVLGGGFFYGNVLLYL